MLKMPSKLIRILRITFCYKQLCGRCLVHMTPVVKVVIHCALALLYAKYISDNLIYKEQRACRLTVTSRMSTNTGNRGPLKRMNTTPDVRHIVPLLWTQSIKKQYRNSDATGRVARRRSHGTVRRCLAGGRRSIASAFLFTAGLEHAILHWSVRKQPQRIEFEMKWSWPFVKHTKVLSTATNITNPSGEYTDPIL